MRRKSHTQSHQPPQTQDLHTLHTTRTTTATAAVHRRSSAEGAAKAHYYTTDWDFWGKEGVGQGCIMQGRGCTALLLG